MTSANKRRARFLLSMIQLTGLSSGSRHHSRDDILERIQELNPLSPIEECANRVLSPPGSAEKYDKDSKTVKPLHEWQLFRPSRSSFAEGTGTSHLTPTQSQGDDGSNKEEYSGRAVERIRLAIATDMRVYATLCFFDCYCLTKGHTNAVIKSVSAAYQKTPPVGGTEMRSLYPNREWSPEVLMEFTVFLSQFQYFLNSNIRALSKVDLDVMARKEQEELKSLLKGLVFANAPLLTLEVVNKHGMASPAATGFAGMLRKLAPKFGNVPTLAVLSLALNARSKTPQGIGGIAFYDSTVLPAVQEFLQIIMVRHYCRTMIKGNEMSRVEADHLRQMRTSMEKGTPTIPNILEKLLCATMKALAGGVDVERKGSAPCIQETVAIAAEGVSRTEAAASRVGVDPDGDSDGVVTSAGAHGNGNEQNPAALESSEMIERIRRQFDAIIDTRFLPRQCLKNIAYLCKYERRAELEDTLAQRMRPDSETEYSGSPDNEESESDESTTLLQIRQASNRKGLTTLESSNDKDNSRCTDDESESEDSDASMTLLQLKQASYRNGLVTRKSNDAKIKATDGVTGRKRQLPPETHREIHPRESRQRCDEDSVLSESTPMTPCERDTVGRKTTTVALPIQETPSQESVFSESTNDREAPTAHGSILPSFPTQYDNVRSGEGTRARANEMPTTDEEDDAEDELGHHKMWKVRNRGTRARCAIMEDTDSDSE